MTIDTKGFKGDFAARLPEVIFGAYRATAVVAEDEDTVTATTPQGPVGGGVVDVTVVSQKGRVARLSNAFVYTP